MTTRRARALSSTFIALLLPIARAQEPARPAPRPDDGRAIELPDELKPQDAVVRTSAGAIVRAAAAAFQAHAWIDPQAADVQVSFSSGGPLTWGALKVILDQVDVVIVEGQPDAAGPWVIRAHHRRGLSQREGPAWRLVDPKDIPRDDELVTVVVDVVHGAGNAIFAAVRGLLCRDVNRIGNVLYIQGAQKIIIVDLASKARYYADVVARLDVPAAAAPSLVLRLANASPERVASTLERVLGSAGSVPDPDALRAAPDARTRQVVVTGDEASLAAAARIAAALDAEAEELRAQVAVRFFELRAADTAATWQALRSGLQALEAAAGTRAHVEVMPPLGKRVAVAARADDFPRVEELLRAIDGP